MASLTSIRRLLFFYLFRDFDNNTFDAGLEFMTLRPVEGGRILCQAATLNMKGVRRDRFVVESSDRSIVNLPGRYICYWVNDCDERAWIYNRTYRRAEDGTYHHRSPDAKSIIKFDKDGLEKGAENLVSSPRRYYEKFVRLLSF